MQDIIVIGIAGGTGSGKTTLAEKIIEHFGGKIVIVHHDNYYREYKNMTYEQRSKINFDHPDSFETDLMIEDIKKLKRGETVYCPVYDYTVHNRIDKRLTVEPRPIILIEGILIFSDKRLCDLMDIKIFVDTDADIRLIRRIKRDMQPDAGLSNQFLHSILIPLNRCMTFTLSRVKKWLTLLFKRAGKTPLLWI